MIKNKDIDSVVESLTFVYKKMLQYNYLQFSYGVKRVIAHLKNISPDHLHNALSCWSTLSRAGFHFQVYSDNPKQDRKVNKEIQEHIDIIDQFFDELFNELRVIGTY